MMGFFIFLHTACCVLLTVVILMQSGRGGGLTESFASAESMFGAKTNQMMVKTTTILGIVFLVTSLTLAYLSSQREMSLMDTQKIAPKVATEEIEIPIPPVENQDPGL